MIMTTTEQPQTGIGSDALLAGEPVDTYEKELAQTQQLFEFLQGEIPDGYRIARGHRPKLTADQAWTVIWYLGNQYWQVPDYIERCDVCGDLYHSHREGDTLDYGKSPIFFCDGCMMNGDEYAKKSKRRKSR